ncbi:MAG: polyprenyl synthetase family protein [Anaerolineaceae bacterium]
MTLSYQELIQKDITRVEDLMRAQADGLTDDLKAATRIMIAAGGKRIRPALALLIGNLLGGDIQRLITLSAAIELLHTATLVHDDLIDGALLRRGVPTLSSKWSPGATVLTGDFMFARAARLAAETGSLDVMKIFAQTLSTIVNGEIEQLFVTQCAADRKSYLQRIYSKTASLFETTAISAALISSEDPKIHQQFSKYGYSLGMAFQIIDDIMDFTADAIKVGKPVGNDLRQGIVTLPVIIYKENHPDDEEISSLIHGKCLEEGNIKRIVDKVKNSDAISLARNEAEQYVRQAITNLNDVEPGVFKTALLELSGFITQRAS